MRSLLALLLVVVSVSFLYGLTIDTYAENSGTTTTTYFCTCQNVNNTCFIQPAGSAAVAIGGHRAQIEVPRNLSVTPVWYGGCRGGPSRGYYQYCSSGLSSQTGCPRTGCTGQYGTGGQLSFSTPPNSASQLFQIWDGGCPGNFSDINKVGLGGVDLTDGGISDSFNIAIGKVDLDAVLTVYIWSDANRGSYSSFDPNILGRQANLNNAYARATLGFTQSFQTIPGLSSGADFSNVGAIAVEILGVNSLDLIIALIETSSSLELRKSAAITSDSVNIGVADTNDVITYSLSLSYNGLGTDLQNVYLWDDPSVNFKNNGTSNYFPYYSLVPGSLNVTTFTIDPISGALTPSVINYTEVNGPNVQANLGRVVLYLGAVTEYTQYNVSFGIRIPSTLPCCLPTCKANCGSSTGGESCYCIANTAYFCTENDGLYLGGRDASGNQPNFTTAFVDANCGYATPATGGRVGAGQSVTPLIIVTPVYAPSSPYVVFSSPAPPSTAAPGQSVCATFTAGNNGTRDTAASVALSYNNAYLTPTTTGSSTGFTCASGTCTSNGLVSMPALVSAPYTLCFTANALATCAPVPVSFTVAITPNGCNSTTIVGPVDQVNGVAVIGNNPVAPCVDINTADNSATSTTTTISGSAIVSLTTNFTTTAIAPGATSLLSFCYSNTGNTPSTNSRLTVTLPNGVSASGTSWTVSGTTATYTIGTIQPNTVCGPVSSLTITYTAATLTCANANLNFVSALNSDCGNASVSSTLTPTGNTAITLTKTASSSSVLVGSVVTFSLTYTNSGARQFDTVTLNDTVPANTVYTGSNGWVCSPNNNAGSVCTVTLAANGVAVPFQVTVNANTDCGTNSINNTATAQGYCAGSPPTFATSIVPASASVTLTGNPDFFVTKVATNGAGGAITGVQAGGQVTYVISYGNRGQRYSAATLTEGAVGAPFTFVGPATWSAANANGQRTITLPTLAPGQTGNVTFVVQSTTTLASCSNVTVPNTVSIAAIAPCVDNNLADNTATASASISASVDLYINFVNVTTYTIPTSTTANLQFCYGNLGNSGATNASMTITLPAGITIATAGNSGFVSNGQSVSYYIGYVNPNQAQTCRTLIVNLPSTLNCTDQSFANIATITSDCNEVNVTNNQTPYQFGITATFDLYIAKTQPANISLTQASPQITYCITYGNNGAKTVTPVTIYEYLPANTAFVASLSDSRFALSSAGVYTLNLGTVAANTQVNTCINFTVTVGLPIPSGLSSITNYVSISNNGVCGAEVTLTNNNASVTTGIVGNPDLFVLKTNNGASFFGSGAVSSASGSAFTGNVVVYTISYGNNGDADAINATLTENVPANTVYDRANSNSAWSCADGAVAGTTCTASIGRVPIAANRAQGVIQGSVTFAVRATSYAGATTTPALRCPTNPTTNVVSINVVAPQVDLNQANNQANATTPFLGLPNLYITKAAVSPSTVYGSGDTIVYNVTYGNNGVKEAVNVVITDTIPQYTLFSASGSSAGLVCSSGGVAGSNCSFSAGNIAPGATGSFSLAVVLQRGFPASATSTENCVVIANNCEGGNETTFVDNQACAVVTIRGFYDLILQKHGYCESILFTMNYENVGTIGARDVYLKTYIPQDSMFDANNSATGWICNANTPGAECRYMVTESNPQQPGVLDFLAPGAGGSVNFAVTPYEHSMSTTYTLDSSVDGNFSGDNLDPTPDNNRASTTVGFSGCAACDSCCPEVDQCCPDYTTVTFGFGGVLDGLNTCSN